MKLVKIFSILGLVMMAAACGSSQPTTGALGAYGVTGFPQNGVYPGGSVLIGGVRQVQGNYLQASAYVNAGDHITVNMTGMVYNVAAATCGTQWYNTITLTNPPGGSTLTPLTNVSVTFNGQAINGSLVAPSAGTVMLTATLDPSPFHVRCSDLYNNQIGNVVAYNVNLANVVTK